MCGITGFTWEDRELVKQMTTVLSHRGPDDTGYFTDKQISLGHARLSIVDLSSAGHQPMTNENETIHIVYNGEIYNFKELKKTLESKHSFKSDTDTEVLIHGYEEWGPELLNKLNGMFAFALWDSAKKQLLLARDRVGIKPLYYTIHNNQLIFASEIKSIFAHKNLPKNISVDSLNFFLKYRFIPSANTMINSIKKLLPGHYAVFSNGRLKINKYWDINWNPQPIGEQAAVKKLRLLLEDSVKKRLMSDVSLGAYLSGGVDSSTIVALNSKIRPDPVKTFTIGFGHESDEFAYARQIAEKFGCEHSEIMLDFEKMTKAINKIVYLMDEPNSDITMFPLYFLAKESKKKATVINTGEGADELFAGYPHYLAGAPKLTAIPSYLKVAAYKKYYSPFNKTQRTKIIKEKFCDEDILGDCLSKTKKPTSTLNKILLFDIKQELPNWQLTRVDRMTMASSQEARVPFLDHRIIEFSATLPTSLKIKNFTGKYILKQATKDLLPPKISSRSKQGFTTPMHTWLKKSLLSQVQNTLSKQSLRNSPINHKYADKLIERYKHSKKQRPLVRTPYQLIMLLLFEKWRKQFLLTD